LIRQRIYIDTSVIGGVFDQEFAKDTAIFFERVRTGEIIVVHSELTNAELADAPNIVKSFLSTLPLSQQEFLLVTPEAANLADTYIREKVVGKTSLADCLHIALATIHKVDILVSWNFKHIVNISRIRGYNSVNLRLGFPTLEIRTPKEI
jgi:hypothetical protein